MSEINPPPVPKGVVVPEHLIYYINNTCKTLKEEQKCALTKLIQERDAFGRAKYGQPLMTEDGRNGVQDAHEELGDLLQYYFKCKLAQEKTDSFDTLLEAAYQLLQELK